MTAQSVFERAVTASLGVSFGCADRFASGAAPAGILGAICYGSGASHALTGRIPAVSIDIEPFNTSVASEIWTTSEPVRVEARGGVIMSASPSLLFGVLTADKSAASLEQAAHDLYAQLFALIDRQGYPHLLRLWNYFPAITADEGGLERYRRFTLGRHEAFVERGRTIERAPAACALGSRSGPLTLVFLASHRSPQPIENPRQISAYRYPERYGPRSPTFSRAVLARIGARSQLFISGTASIVGHESCHAGDALAQAREAMVNIGAVLGEARKAGLGSSGRLLLKAYVRRAEDLSGVRSVITSKLGPTDDVMFLKADICRPELLVEIEGTWLQSDCEEQER